MNKTKLKPKTALVHDLFRIRGGGERLTLTLANELADTLCFGYRTADSFDIESMTRSRIVDLQACGGIIGVRTFKLMYAFRRKTQFLADFDAVIYSGILSPTAVYNHLNGPNILYCHTPPRFAYDKYAVHLKNLTPWKRPLMQLYVPCLKALYEPAVRRMDLVVANSQHVRERIKKYLGLDSTVVYPPVDTQQYAWLGQEDYYLSTARMDPLKRLDVVIKAFKLMPDKKLVVASGGSELPRLKALAQGAANISFTGWVDDTRLKQLVGNCIATIYIPQHEDFGMSPVESMAAGKPVVGVQEGGLKESLLPGETGLLVKPDPGPDDVIAAVAELTPDRAHSMRQACEERSRQFDTRIFLERMREVVERFF